MRSILHGLAGLLCACLAGCETTQVQVQEGAAPGAPSCSVGISPAQRTVAVEVWRGQESSLAGYSTQRVCERLDQVSRELQTQGVSVRFELLGGVQSQASLGVADTTRDCVAAHAGGLYRRDCSFDGVAPGHAALLRMHADDAPP